MDVQDKNNLDRWLNTALEQYGSAEPRAGLECRILANLEANAASVNRRFHWAFSMAAAAALVLAGWLGVRVLITGSHHTAENTANQTSGVDRKTEPQMTSPKVSTMRARKRARPSLGDVRPTVAERGAPRLSQFPSPRPLSQEELLFVSYAQRFPEEAMLIAQEQEKFEKEIRQAEQQLQSSSSDSDQER